MNKVVNNIKIYDQFEIIDIICEYINLINIHCKYIQFTITDEEWNMLFTEVYAYLQSINREKDYFGVLYVSINKAINNFLIQEKEKIELTDIIEAMDEIKYISFNAKQINILKTFISERLKTLNERKVIYLSKFRK